MTYRDERGERCLTGEARDERYHVAFDLDAGQGRWRIDLSVWLRTCTATSPTGICGCATPSPTPSGWEIYTAVLRDGVRTPEQFAHWLAANGFPGPDGA